MTQAKLAAEVTTKQPLWAVVNPDGTLARGSGATASGRAAGFAAGVYTVTFNRNVTQCAYMATIGAPGTTPPTLGGQVLAYVNPNPNGQVITVRTFAADAEDDAAPDRRATRSPARPAARPSTGTRRTAASSSSSTADRPATSSQMRGR